MAHDGTLGIDIVFNDKTQTGIDKIKQRLNELQATATSITTAINNIATATKGALSTPFDVEGLKSLSKLDFSKLNNLDLSKATSSFSSFAAAVKQNAETIKSTAGSLNSIIDTINRYNTAVNNAKSNSSSAAAKSSSANATDEKVLRRIYALEVDLIRAQSLKAQAQRQGIAAAVAAYDKLIIKLKQIQAQALQVQNGSLVMTNAQFSGARQYAKTEAAAMAKAARDSAREEAKAARETQRATEGAANAQRGLASAAGRASQQMRYQSGIAQQLRSHLMMYFNTFSIANFIRQLIVVGGEFEKQHVALQVLMGDIQKANTLYGQMKSLALHSPFTFQQLLKDTRQVAAFGIPNEQLYDTTKRLADLSAGLGVSMDRLILAYGQVRTATVLRGQEMRQFTEAGVPLPEMLARIKTEKNKLNGSDEIVNSRDIFDMMKKKEVSFEEVDMAIRELTSEGGRFYQMQEKMAETLAGKWARLSDAWGLMVSTISNSDSVLGSFFKGTLDVLVKLLGVFNSFGPGLLTGLATLGAMKLGRSAVEGGRGWYERRRDAFWQGYGNYRKLHELDTQANINQMQAKYASAWAKNGNLSQSFALAGLSQQQLKNTIAMNIQRGYLTKEMQEQLVLEGLITQEELKQMRIGQGKYGKRLQGMEKVGGVASGLYSALGGGWGIALMGASIAAGGLAQLSQMDKERQREQKTLEESASQRYENLRQYAEQNPLTIRMEYVDEKGNKHLDPYDAVIQSELIKKGISVEVRLDMTDSEVSESIKGYKNILTENVGASLNRIMMSREQDMPNDKYLLLLKERAEAVQQAMAYIKTNAAEISQILNSSSRWTEESISTNIGDYIKNVGRFEAMLAARKQKTNKEGGVDSEAKVFEEISKAAKKAGRDVEQFNKVFKYYKERLPFREALYKASPIDTYNYFSNKDDDKLTELDRSSALEQIKRVAAEINEEMNAAGKKIGTETGDTFFWALVDELTAESGMTDDVLSEFYLMLANSVGGDNEGLMKDAIKNVIMTNLSASFTKEELEAAINKGELTEAMYSSIVSSLKDIEARFSDLPLGKVASSILKSIGSSFNSPAAMSFAKQSIDDAQSELQKYLLNKLRDSSNDIKQIIKTEADIDQMHEQVSKLRDETIKRLRLMQKALKLKLPIEISAKMDSSSIKKMVAFLRKQAEGKNFFLKTAFNQFADMFERYDRDFNSWERETGMSLHSDAQEREENRRQKAAEAAERKRQQAQDRARRQQEEAQRKAEKAARKRLRAIQEDMNNFSKMNKAWEELLELGYSPDEAEEYIATSPYKAAYDALRKDYGNEWMFGDEKSFYNAWEKKIKEFKNGQGKIISEDVESAIESSASRQLDADASNLLEIYKRRVEALKEELRIEKERFSLYEKMREFFGSGRSASMLVYGSDRVGVGKDTLGFYEASSFRLLKTRLENLSEFNRWREKNPNNDIWSFLSMSETELTDKKSSKYVSPKGALWDIRKEAINALQREFGGAIDFAKKWDDGGRDYVRQEYNVRETQRRNTETVYDYVELLKKEIEQEIARRDREGINDAHTAELRNVFEQFQTETDLSTANVSVSKNNPFHVYIDALNKMFAAINKEAERELENIRIKKRFFSDEAGGQAVLNSLESLPVVYLQDAIERLKALISEHPEGGDYDNYAKLLEAYNKLSIELNSRGIKGLFRGVGATDFIDRILSQDPINGKYTVGENKYGIKPGEYERGALLDLRKNFADAFSKGLKTLAQGFESAESALEPLLQLLEQLGHTGLKNVVSGASNAMNSAVNMSTGVQGIAKLFGAKDGLLNSLGQYSAIAGAGFSIITSIFSNREERIRRQIEALNRHVEKMEGIMGVMQSVLERQLGLITEWSVDDAKFAFGEDNYNKFLAAAAAEATGGLSAAYERAMSGGYDYSWKDVRDAYTQNIVEWLNKAGTNVSYSDISKNVGSLSKIDPNEAAIGRAILENDYVTQQMAMLESEIADKQKIISKELESKNTNYGEVDKLQNELKELQLKLAYFREDMAQSRWGVSLVDYASQFGDALVTAFANGEDAANAFDNTVNGILSNLTKQFLIKSMIEPLFNNLREKWFGKEGYFGEGSENSSDLSANEIAAMAKDVLMLEDGMLAAKQVFESINEATGGRLDSLNSSGSSASIQSVTEETANILVSYVNAIRADVSMLKEFGNQDREMPVLAQAQLQQLSMIAHSTEKNASAAEEILSIFQSVTNGTRSVAVE